MLSRARHGMVVLGNSETLKASRQGGALWTTLFTQLTATGAMVEALPTVCQLHPDDMHALRTPNEFRELRPNGGCCLPCTYRMDCGHKCPQFCHALDQEHKNVRCQEKCMRTCPQGHPCPKKCWELCGGCVVPENLRLPACSHVQVVTCFQANDPEELSKVVCRTRIPSFVVPRCGHAQCRTICGNALSSNPVCSEACSLVLPCSHPCPGGCERCFKTGEHARCDKACKRLLLCGHECDAACHVSDGDCKPCKKACGVRCEHSRCPNACNEVCNPCLEPCAWGECPHRRGCSFPCGAPCERLPCDVRCNKVLEVSDGFNFLMLNITIIDNSSSFLSTFLGLRSVVTDAHRSAARSAPRPRIAESADSQTT
jgi:hypothetical protein